MKNQLRDQPSVSVNCREHKQKCMFVCLHKTCPNSFKIGCQKCRKDHGQHPNRLISLNDFHQMLAKPIRYLQTFTAYKLMNLKKKIEYIRDFRTTILQRQIELMESNKSIKGVIAAILEQHYKIRGVVSHLDPEALVNNFTDYTDNLSKCREFMAYNPVKGDLVFNNQIIKGSRVQLEKYLKKSQDLVDSIRQFLVKIIEVLLANCIHEEDDDDIQFQNEGDSPTTFNIYIKTRTDVTQTPNIKSKLEHETFLEMFDQQKQAFNQQVQILEKELDLRATILNKIKSSSHTNKDNSHSEDNQILSIEKQQEAEVENKDRKDSAQFRYTADSLFQKSKRNNEIAEIKEEYEAILVMKDERIQELKDTCLKLQETLEEWQTTSAFKQESKIDPQVFEKNIVIIQDYENTNSVLKDKVEQMDQAMKNDQKELTRKENEVKDLKNKLQVMEKKASKKQPPRNPKQLEKLNKQNDEMKVKIQKLEEDLLRKDNQISRQKKKYTDLEKLVDKMKESNEQSEKQVLQWRDQHEQREKMLRVEFDRQNKELEQLHSKLSDSNQRVKQLEIKIVKHEQTIKQKTRFINEKDKQIAAKESKLKDEGRRRQDEDKNLKDKSQKIKEKEQNQNQQINSLLQRQNQLKQHVKRLTQQLRQKQKSMTISRKTQQTSKTLEQQNKKIIQIKDMLQISIHKNQELKDKNYQLEIQIQTLRQKLQFKEVHSPKSNGQRTFCEDEPMRNNTFSGQFAELSHLNTVNSDYLDPQSPSFRKRGIETTLRDKKGAMNKQQKRQLYQAIKAKFHVVAEDMNILQERVKQNEVIEKVYLKELQRKRTQNKNLKKDLDHCKTFGSNYKHSDMNRAVSPVNKGRTDRDKQESKVSQNSPLNVQSVKSQYQGAISKKTSKIQK